MHTYNSLTGYGPCRLYWLIYSFLMNFKENVNVMFDKSMPVLLTRASYL